MGGNAQVFQVRNKKDNKEYALKELVHRKNEEKKFRFREEINIMKNNWKKIEGIIPIFDFSYTKFWYTMPIAKPIISHIEEQNIKIDDIVMGIIQLCETLEKLHKKNVSHRDIKPSNIYFYKKRFCFGDFGLVDFPDNSKNFTKSYRGLGAIFTIAPEMKRNPKNADAKKADVYSLAKTMWMLLTKDEKGFDGVYNFLDESHGLHFIDDYKKEHLVEIEELLLDSTSNNPDVRPTIKEFKERLQNWIKIKSNRNKSQASDWNFLNKQLFGMYPPDSSSWKDTDKIINILNIIASTPAYNHMLFHTGGGLDFSRAKKANENDCIKLYDEIGYCYVVKPKILYFEGFGKNYKWNYFLLELDRLNYIFESNEFDCEYLVEDFPGNYVSAQYAQYEVYDYDNGIPLPKGFELVYRYTKGRLLIVMKDGPYNGINGTYDGRHGECSISDFREYVDLLLSYYLKIYNRIIQKRLFDDFSEEEVEEKILQLDLFNKNPFNNSFDFKEKFEIKNEIDARNKRNNYIKENYLNWNFTDVLSKYTVSSLTNIIFIFEFNLLSENTLCELFNQEHYCLNKNGNIEKINSSKFDRECFCCSDRDVSVTIRDSLIKRINEILNQNNLVELDKSDISFSIKLVKNGLPQHLFSKKEIEDAMRAADDRFNNQLVIDENGYAKVIRDEGYGYLYPVSHESWNAGNLYVGKYSKLSSLEDNYISLLQGWLLYLMTGKHQYMDYVHNNKNIEELLTKIKEFYK